MERVSPTASAALWVICSLNVSRLASVFKSIYSVSFRVSREFLRALVFYCHCGNKFLTSEHESRRLPDVFTAETRHGPNHLSSSQELPLAKMMRSSKRPKKTIFEKCYQRKSFGSSRFLLSSLDLESGILNL